MKRKNNLELFLLIAIITISGTLFMAARSAAIGRLELVEKSSVFVGAEIFGGLGLAMLESLALWYVAGAWYRLNRRRLEWYILGGIMVSLLFMIPITSTPSLMAMQYKEDITQVLRWHHLIVNHLSWLWTFVLASVASVMAFSIGIAGAVYETLSAEGKQADPGAVVLNAAIKHGTIKPVVLAKDTGLTVAQVEAELEPVARLFSVNGSGK